MELLGDGFFFNTFLEGSVDHIIYRDYIDNGSSLMDCSLATRKRSGLFASRRGHADTARSLCLSDLTPDQLERVERDGRTGSSCGH